MQKMILTIFLLFSFSEVYCQVTDSVYHKPIQKNLSLLTGLFYNNRAFVDLGIAINTNGTVGPHPMSSAYFIANEFHLVNHKLVIGPKIGAWIGGGMSALALGVNAIYYSDFEQGSLVFRPEIGLGAGNFKLTVGYNCPLTNSSFKSIARSMVGLTYCFKLKKVRMRKEK